MKYLTAYWLCEIWYEPSLGRYRNVKNIGVFVFSTHRVRNKAGLYFSLWAGSCRSPLLFGLTFSKVKLLLWALIDLYWCSAGLNFKPFLDRNSVFAPPTEFWPMRCFELQKHKSHRGVSVENMLVPLMWATIVQLVTSDIKDILLRPCKNIWGQKFCCRIFINDRAEFQSNFESFYWDVFREFWEFDWKFRRRIPFKIFHEFLWNFQGFVWMFGLFWGQFSMYLGWNLFVYFLIFD